MIGLHEGIPPGASLVDNESGRRSALARLAALVEDENVSMTARF